jgi:predicted O-methyltransferase YrrM
MISNSHSVLRRPGITCGDRLTSYRAGWLPQLKTILQGKDLESGLYTQSDQYEIYYELGAQLTPASILEIGVRFGYSLASLACGANLFKNVFGVDAEVYEPGSNAVAKQSLKSLGINATLFQSTSDEFDTGRTGLTSFDLVHIDGDHTTEGALRDLLHYSRVSRKILIDDVLDARVWAAVQAFTAAQTAGPISSTWFNTETGMLLLEL